MRSCPDRGRHDRIQARRRNLAGVERCLHLLIRYIVDRRDNENRWVQALENTDVPLSFVWGIRDPISGAHMAERIRERVPQARPFAALRLSRVAGAVLGPRSNPTRAGDKRLTATKARTLSLLSVLTHQRAPAGATYRKHKCTDARNSSHCTEPVQTPGGLAAGECDGSRRPAKVCSISQRSRWRAYGVCPRGVLVDITSLFFRSGDISPGHLPVWARPVGISLRGSGARCGSGPSPSWSGSHVSLGENHVLGHRPDSFRDRSL